MDEMFDNGELGRLYPIITVTEHIFENCTYLQCHRNDRGHFSLLAKIIPVYLKVTSD